MDEEIRKLREIENKKKKDLEDTRSVELYELWKKIINEHITNNLQFIKECAATTSSKSDTRLNIVLPTSPTNTETERHNWYVTGAEQRAFNLLKKWFKETYGSIVHIPDKLYSKQPTESIFNIGLYWTSGDEIFINKRIVQDDTPDIKKEIITDSQTDSILPEKDSLLFRRNIGKAQDLLKHVVDTNGNVCEINKILDELNTSVKNIENVLDAVTNINTNVTFLVKKSKSRMCVIM